MPDMLHRVGINAAIEKIFVPLFEQVGLAGWWTGGRKSFASNRRNHIC